MNPLEESLLELLRRASCELSKDVLDALERAYRAEDDASNAKVALDFIRENIALASLENLPLCPEPVTIHLYVSCPRQFDTMEFEERATAAVVEATKRGHLLDGMLDPVSGRRARENIGPGHPVFHYDPEDRKDVEVRVLLDNSGEVAPGAQYILPEEKIGAARDLNGARRAALHTLVQSQGSGSGPGLLAVGIGGDRTTGIALAHRQLLRPLNERSGSRALAQLETRILEEANTLGLGPLGFGGKTALLSAKVAAQTSTASSFVVSVCYMGWAIRRQGIRIDSSGKILEWLYDAKEPALESELAAAGDDGAKPLTEGAPPAEDEPKKAAEKKTAAATSAKKAKSPPSASKASPAAKKSASKSAAASSQSGKTKGATEKKPPAKSTPATPATRKGATKAKKAKKATKKKTTKRKAGKS